MNRTNQILTGLIVLQAAFFGSMYAFCGGPESSGVSRLLLLGDFDRETVSKVTIEDKDGAIMTLARAGDGWALPDKADYPADPEKVSKLMGSLLGMESGYVVSKGDDHHVDLEVATDKFRRKVTIESPQEKITLIVGSRGKGGFTHVRLGKKPMVYAVDDFNEWTLGTRVFDWAQREFFKVEADRLMKLEIQRGAETVALERSSIEDWRMAGKPVVKTQIDSLVDKATKIELSDILGKSADPQIMKKLESGADPVLVTLSMTKDMIPLSADPPVPPPGIPGMPNTPPDASPPPVPGAPGDPTVPGSEGFTSDPSPRVLEVAEKKLLRFVANPDKDTSVLLFVDGATHAVEVEKWRVSALLEADPQKLLGLKSE